MSRSLLSQLARHLAEHLPGCCLSRESWELRPYNEEQPSQRMSSIRMSHLKLVLSLQVATAMAGSTTAMEAAMTTVGATIMEATTTEATTMEAPAVVATAAVAATAAAIATAIREAPTATRAALTTTTTTMGTMGTQVRLQSHSRWTRPRQGAPLGKLQPEQGTHEAESPACKDTACHWIASKHPALSRSHAARLRSLVTSPDAKHGSSHARCA